LINFQHSSIKNENIDFYIIDKMIENNWEIIPSPRKEEKDEKPPALKRTVSSIFRGKKKSPRPAPKSESLKSERLRTKKQK